MIEVEKIFVLSFDDGTIYDERFIELLNKYNLPATFNLNSGLEDFVWYFGDRPIRRIHIKDKAYMYRGHEVASHSYTHPYLTSLSEQQLRDEINKDCMNLKDIFGLDTLGFGVPFTACNEREINIIKNTGHIDYIRLSSMKNDFMFPRDEYHIEISGLYNDENIKERIYDFSRSDLKRALFVLCGHSYELEMHNHWDYMEELLKYIKSFDFQIMTVRDFVNKYYKG